MKKYTYSFMLDEEEEKEWKRYIKSKIMESDSLSVNKSDIIREALFKYIRNGKPDNEQTPTKDDKPPAEQPAKNPFADINF